VGSILKGNGHFYTNICTRTTKTWQLSIITWTSRWPYRGQIVRPILCLRPPVRSPKCSFGGGTSPVEGARSQRCDLGLPPKNIVVTILNELKANFKTIDESVRNDYTTLIQSTWIPDSKIRTYYWKQSNVLYNWTLKQ
jgi:hypothetical protein